MAMDQPFITLVRRGHTVSRQTMHSNKFRYNARLGSVFVESVIQSNRAMATLLVELLHLRNDLFESSQPFVEFLLNFGFRFAQLWVECSSVGTRLHGELWNRQVESARRNNALRIDMDLPRRWGGPSCRDEASNCLRTPFGMRQTTLPTGSVAIVGDRWR
jgi:hypothetical protein